MEDYLRLLFPEYLSEVIPVSDITDDGFDVDIEQRKMAGLGRRRQGITGVISAPSRVSHSNSQEPLKPVWPVMSTFLFR